jgi:hypothetical protein
LDHEAQKIDILVEGRKELFDNAMYDVGGRILFQLQGFKEDWSSFVSKEYARVSISSVSSILLVDGMHELPHEKGSEESRFYKVMQSLSQEVSHSQHVFVSILCASTVLSPFTEFVSSSSFKENSYT